MVKCHWLLIGDAGCSDHSVRDGYKNKKIKSVISFASETFGAFTTQRDGGEELQRKIFRFVSNFVVFVPFSLCTLWLKEVSAKRSR